MKKIALAVIAAIAVAATSPAFAATSSLMHAYWIGR
jgi:hypothetical protein